MKIEVKNRQQLCRPNIPKIRKLVRQLMKMALKLDPGTRWSEISVVLLDNSGIRDMNRHFLDKDNVTDVLSLRYAPVPGDNEYLTGEIFVNIQRAFQCPSKPGSKWNASRELALYLAHGCDHLMNSTDYKDSGYRRMRRRELGWLKEPAITGPSSNLFKAAARRLARKT